MITTAHRDKDFVVYMESLDKAVVDVDISFAAGVTCRQQIGTRPYVHRSKCQ